MRELLIETFFLIFLATLGIYEGVRLTKATLLFHDPIGPGWYLFLVSIILFVCSVSYLLLHLVYDKAEVIARRRRSSLHISPAGLLLILLVLYATAAKIVGYTFGTAFFFVFALRISGVSSWLRSVLIGLAFTVAFQLFFSHLAGIALP